MTDGPEDGPTPIAFEEGLVRLGAIAGRLDEADVSVEETLVLLREARGIEAALRAFLERAEAELRAIEDGTGVPRYEVRGVARTRPREAPPSPEQARLMGAMPSEEDA